MATKEPKPEYEPELPSPDQNLRNAEALATTLLNGEQRLREMSMQLVLTAKEIGEACLQLRIAIEAERRRILREAGGK